MGSEAASRLDVYLLELADGKFRSSNVHQNIGLSIIVRVQSVVRLLPRFLQGDESLGEVADFLRVIRRRLRLPARAPCPAVLQCAVHAMPCRGACPADEQVRRRCRQAVEHGVVGGADGRRSLACVGSPGADSAKTRAAWIMSGGFIAGAHKHTGACAWRHTVAGSRRLRSSAASGKKRTQEKPRSSSRPRVLTRPPLPLGRRRNAAWAPAGLRPPALQCGTRRLP